MPSSESRSLLDVVAPLIECFDLPGRALSAEPLAGGHIHDSVVVTLAPSAGAARRVLLQRINTRVFPHVPTLMDNVARVARHLASNQPAPAAPADRRASLRYIPTRTGGLALETADHGVWRLMQYIEPHATFVVAPSDDVAERAAFAFGDFQRRLLDLPAPPLHEIIPHFHDTPRRFESLEAAVSNDSAGRAGAAAAEIALARSLASHASALLDLRRAGALGERVVHNDAKLSNVLFDPRTGAPLCVIDLDTVMPGLGLYDFGDLARSMGTHAAEDERDLARVEIDPDRFAALARGYLRGIGDRLADVERDHLVAAAVVITLEQGVRFLTDHLCGDAYYRVARAGHNFDRARTQLKLVGSLLRQQRVLRAGVSS
ncbi:MAG: aminoglycoside phosphotransferase family protein [Phycisphaerae bacterium]